MIFEEVNLKEEIKNIYEMMILRTKLRKIELIQELDDDLPEVYYTEPRRLK